MNVEVIFVALLHFLYLQFSGLLGFLAQDLLEALVHTMALLDKRVDHFVKSDIILHLAHLDVALLDKLCCETDLFTFFDQSKRFSIGGRGGFDFLSLTISVGILLFIVGCISKKVWNMVTFSQVVLTVGDHDKDSHPDNIIEGQNELPPDQTV